MSRYEVILQFSPNGPTVTGTWNTAGPPRRMYRKWVGLYGNGSSIIRLIEETDGGHRQVLKSWPPPV